MKKTLLSTLSLCLAMTSVFAQESFSIDSLMAKMTLEEKIGQMNQLVGPKLTGAVSNSGVPDKIRAGQVGSITRPVKELKGFKQVCMKAGSGMRVELELDSSKLGFYNSDLKYVVEPSEFEVMVGPSSDSRSLLCSAFVLE